MKQTRLKGSNRVSGGDKGGGVWIRLTNGARATQRVSREVKGVQEGDAARANRTAERAGRGKWAHMGSGGGRG